MENLTKEEIQPLLDAHGNEIQEQYDRLVILHPADYPELVKEVRDRKRWEEEHPITTKA